MFKKLIVALVALSFCASTAMAGTATLSSVTRTTWGNKRVVMGTMTISGAYGASGISCAPSKFGLRVVQNVFFMPTVGYTQYNFSWESSYVKVDYAELNTNKPATTTVATSDTFIVKNKALTASDAETLLVTVSPLFGAAPYATLVALGSVQGDTEAKKNYNKFTASDDATACFMNDTITCPQVGVLDASIVNADTVFFDYNGTDRASRLYYSGTNLGNMGDLYMPFGNGNFIKIAKATNSAITVANAKPLYFVRADADLGADKLQCDAQGALDNTNGFMADSTYTSLPRYRPYPTTMSSTWPITAVVKFIAIGN